MEAKAKTCYKCGQEGHIVCPMFHIKHISIDYVFSLETVPKVELLVVAMVEAILKPRVKSVIVAGR